MLVNDIKMPNVTDPAMPALMRLSPRILSRHLSLCSVQGGKEVSEDVTAGWIRRVAGNVVNDFVMGSIVNAVQLLGVRLVVVLGHTKCGMVARAVHSWAKHEARKLSGAKQAAAGKVRAWSFCTLSSRWSLSPRSAPASNAQTAPHALVQPRARCTCSGMADCAPTQGLRY